MNPDRLLKYSLMLTENQEKNDLVCVFLSILRSYPGVAEALMYDVKIVDESQRSVEGNIAFKPSDEMCILESIPDHIEETMYEYVMANRRTPGRFKSSKGDLLLYPLYDGSGPYAILSINITDDFLEYMDDLEYLVRIFGNLMGHTILSQKDALTGLLNRQSFVSAMKNYVIPKSKDSMHNYFALLDLDHFKMVNDTFGHVLGDEVLIVFARTLKSVFRDTDMLFRYGGEEFAVVLFMSEKGSMEGPLDRFRDMIHKTKFPAGIKVTCSGGYARIEEGDSTVRIIEKADRALYYAKSNGRNQIHGYEKLVEKKVIMPVDHASEDVTLWKRSG